jgi:hypothetical protein
MMQTLPCFDSFFKEGGENIAGATVVITASLERWARLGIDLREQSIGVGLAAGVGRYEEDSVRMRRLSGDGLVVEW